MTVFIFQFVYAAVHVLVAYGHIDTVADLVRLFLEHLDKVSQMESDTLDSRKRNDNNNSDNKGDKDTNAAAPPTQSPLISSAIPSSPGLARGGRHKNLLYKHKHILCLPHHIHRLSRHHTYLDTIAHGHCAPVGVGCASVPLGTGRGCGADAHWSASSASEPRSLGHTGSCAHTTALHHTGSL